MVIHQAVNAPNTSTLDIFFVTDRICKGDMEVEWCPTSEMTGYFLTKPNHGSILNKFIDIIK